MIREGKAFERDQSRRGTDDEPATPSIAMIKRPSLGRGERAIKEGGYADDHEVPLGRRANQALGERDAPGLRGMVSNMQSNLSQVIGQTQGGKGQEKDTEKKLDARL